MDSNRKKRQLDEIDDIASKLARVASGDGTDPPNTKPGPTDGDPAAGSSSNHGLKTFLHGIGYQQKLSILIIGLADQQMRKDSTFEFSITCEDPDGGKFDDIGFYFGPKDNRSILFIQAKHKLSQEAIPITWNQLKSASKEQPFALKQYFDCYLKSNWSTMTRPPLLIICTNNGIDQAVKDYMQEYKFEEPIVESIFQTVHGAAFQFNVNKLKEVPASRTDMKAAESNNLAKQLANCIHAGTCVGSNIKVFREYRDFIMTNVVGPLRSNAAGTYELNPQFLNPSCPHTGVVAEVQRKFINAYTKLDTNVRADAESKGVQLTDEFYQSGSVFSQLADALQTDKMLRMEMFFKSLVIVCNTRAERDLDEEIINMWKSRSSAVLPPSVKGPVESDFASKFISQEIFNWMKDRQAKPLQGTDIELLFRRLVSSFHYLQLKGISSVRGKEFDQIGLQIQRTKLEETDLYEECKLWYGAPGPSDPDVNRKYRPLVAWQVLELLKHDFAYEFLLIDRKCFDSQKKTIWDMCCDITFPFILLIEYEEISKDSAFLSDVLRWNLVQTQNGTPKNHKKIILLPTAPTEDEIEFLIEHLEEDSRKKVHEESRKVRLFGTDTGSCTVLYDEDSLRLYLDFINRDAKARMTRDVNAENYADIENMFIERRWETSSERNELLETESSLFFDNNRAPRSESRFLHEIQMTVFQNTLESSSSENETKCSVVSNQIVQKTSPPGSEDDTDRVFILLNDAGSGKSFYLTWLAHQLSAKYRSAWIVKLKLIECSYFFDQYEPTGAIDDQKAIRMLFQFIYLNFIERNFNRNSPDYAAKAFEMAKRCADVLLLSNGHVVLDESRIRDKSLHIASEALVLLRIFRDKFNDKSIWLLMDGFDEIAPYFTKVLLSLLARLVQFDAVRKVHLTSRPYGFRKEFNHAFEKCAFYRLSTFNDDDVIHYIKRFASAEMQQRDLGEENQKYLLAVIYKVTHIYLKNLRTNPLFLYMSLDLVRDIVQKHINDLKSEQNLVQIRAECESLLVPLRMMETFVEKKLAIENLQKTDANVGTSHSAQGKSIVENEKVRIRKILSIMAMQLLFENAKDLKGLLPRESTETLQYLEKINNGSEKSGIVEGTMGNHAVFIHRVFAEYFAALWLFQLQESDRNESDRSLPAVKDFLIREVYGSRYKEEVRRFLDMMVIKGCPNHTTIYYGTPWERVLLSREAHSNLALRSEKDPWGRTLLHLLLCKNDITYQEVQMFDQSLVEKEDTYFRWTVLQYAYCEARKLATTNMRGTLVAHREDEGRESLLDINEVTQRLNSDDVTELFFYTLYIAEYFTQLHISKNADADDDYLVNDIHYLLLKCMAKKLFDEKRLDLHSPMVLAESGKPLSRHIRQLRRLSLRGGKLGDVRTPLDYCVAVDSMLVRTLIEVAGGPEKIPPHVVSHLVRLAWEQSSYVALQYLTIKCQFFLPAIANFKTVLVILTLCMTDEQKFSEVYGQYCLQRNIRCLDVNPHVNPAIYDDPPPATRMLQNLREMLGADGTFPDEMQTPEYGVDIATEFCLKAAFTFELRPIAAYIGQKTILAYDVNYPAKIIDMFFSNWHCSLHFLLDKPEYRSYVDRNGRNLLHIAAGNGWQELVRCLLDHYEFKADTINEHENQWDAFFYCVIDKELQSSRVWAFTELLPQDFKTKFVDRVDSKGNTVLHYAMENNPVIAGIIISDTSNEEITGDWRSAKLLELANYYNTYGCSIVQMLAALEKCCTIEEESVRDVFAIVGIEAHSFEDAEGRNLLHIACSNGWFRSGECLIEHYGFDPLLADNSAMRWNAFFHCVAGREFNIQIFTYLLEKYDMDCFCELDTAGKGVFYYAMKDEKFVDLIMEKEFNAIDFQQQRDNVQVLRFTNLLQSAGLNALDIVDRVAKVCQSNDSWINAVCETLLVSVDLHEYDGTLNLLHISCCEDWLRLVNCSIEDRDFDNGESSWKAFLHGEANPAFSTIVVSAYLVEKYDKTCFRQLNAKGKDIYTYATPAEKIVNFIINREISNNNSTAMSSNENISKLANHLTHTCGLHPLEIIEHLWKFNYRDESWLNTLCDTLRVAEDTYDRNAEGRNLLHIACSNDWLPLVQFLIDQRRFDPFRENEHEHNWNAFFYCVSSEPEEPQYARKVFPFLMQQFQTVCVDKTDRRGNSVFHYALKKHVAIACEIVLKGVSGSGLSDQSAFLTDNLERINVSKEAFHDKLLKWASRENDGAEVLTKMEDILWYGDD